MQKRKTAFQEMKMDLIHSGLDEQSAGEKTHPNVQPIFQKELKGIYMKRLSCG